MATFERRYIDSLYDIVARITIFWGHHEVAIDAMVGGIHFYNQSSLPKAYKRLPTAIQRELDFIDWALENLKILQPFATQGRTVTEYVRNFAKERNRLVHGAIIGVQGDSPEISIRKYETGPVFEPPRLYHVPLAQLEGFAEMLVNTANPVVDFQIRLLRVVLMDAKSRGFNIPDAQIQALDAT